MPNGEDENFSKFNFEVELMYLNQVTEFANFLSQKRFTLQEILDHLLRVVLVPIDPASIVIGSVNENNEIEALARSGISMNDKLSLIDSCSLDDSFPSTDAFRFGKFVWINTLPDWGMNYCNLKRLPEDFPGKTYITFPISMGGTPVSTMAIFSKQVLAYDEEIQSFLTAIGGIFSLHYYRENSIKQKSSKKKDLEFTFNSLEQDGELTERQNVVLQLISEDHTNHDIAEMLGYSESTIRQEIMRIFAKLGCSSRHEASEIYMSWKKD